MAATTIDAIVDRIRSVCAGPTFGLTEAETWDSFDLQPTTNIDQVFRIPPPTSLEVVGGFSYAEDRTDAVQIWVARKHQNDYAAVRKALLRDVHSLTAAIVRDAHQVSGDYGILDRGRSHAIVAERGKDYAVLRLTLPVNFDAQL